MAEKQGKKAAGTVILMAAIILIAKFMGLLRETMVAGIYGQGMESDILNTATQIPLLFFDMVLGVAILSTFVPIFNRRLETEGEASAMAFANTFMTVVCTIAMAAALLGVLLAEPLVRLMTPGYADVPGKLEQTASLLRILFPSIVFTAAAYIAVGILQSYGQFTVPSLISVVSNGVMIFYLAVFGNRLGLWGVAVSMVVAWFLQLVIQLPWLKKFGFRWRLSFHWKDPGIKEAALIALPVLISSWVQPLCNVINMSFGSGLGNGAVSALNWGNKIYIIMVGVFAYAITNFIFPKLSRLGEDKEGFARMTRESLGWMLLVITLISGLFLALSEPIIRVVFQRGAFTAESTKITATALFYYSFGMVGYGICEVLNKSFYAIQDGKTPMFASIFGILVNFVMAFLLVGVLKLGVGGLALATAISSLAIAGWLMVAINRRRPGTITAGFLWNFLKMIVAAGAAALVAAVIYRLTGGMGDGMLITLVRLCIAAIPAVLLYLGLGWIFKIEELRSRGQTNDPQRADNIRPTLLIYHKDMTRRITMQQNLGFFMQLWSIFWVWVQNSQVYRLLRSFYDGISGSWKKSRIANWFRQEHFAPGAQRESLLGKILGFPFTITELLQKKIGPTLSQKMEESAVLNLGRTYLHHMLALNLRFLGYLLAGCGVGTFFGLLCKGQVSLGWLIAALLGGVLAFSDGNVTDWLKESRLVQFICHCFGLNPTFSWYQEARIQGKSRWILALLAGLLAGLAGGVTIPVLGVALLIGLAAVFLVLERPAAGAFALVFLAPLAPTMAMAGLSILAVFSLLMKSITDPDFRWRHDGLGFLLLGFIVIYLFAGVTSFAMAKSLSIWAIYAVFMAAYFLIVNLIRKLGQIRQILVTFVLSGLLVCLYGIAQYLFGWDTTQAWMDEEMFSDIKMRIYSTLENPNVLGEYILLVLPVAIGLFWVGKNFWQKLTYGAISVVLFVALILTFSRGCWVGLLFAAAIFITFSAGKLWGLGLIALPIIPAVLPESIINRFTSIGDMKDSSTSYRVYIWMGTLAMIRDFWVSGIGMGAEAFKAVYPFYSYNGIVAPHSHNLFLQILVESGVAGIGVFLLIVIFFLKRMMTGYQLGGGKGMPLSTMVNAISAGVCGFLLQGMFDNCFYNYRVMLVFWMVLGLGMACVNVAKNASRKEDAL